jgi:hypothetical protein
MVMSRIAHAFVTSFLLGLAASLLPPADAKASPPLVYTAFEGLDATTGMPALLVAGEGLMSVRTYELVDERGNVLGAPEMLEQTDSLVVVGLVVVGLSSSGGRTQVGLRIGYDAGDRLVTRTLGFPHAQRGWTCLTSFGHDPARRSAQTTSEETSVSAFPKADGDLGAALDPFAKGRDSAELLLMAR